MTKYQKIKCKYTVTTNDGVLWKKGKYYIVQSKHFDKIKSITSDSSYFWNLLIETERKIKYKGVERNRFEEFVPEYLKSRFYDIDESEHQLRFDKIKHIKNRITNGS